MNKNLLALVFSFFGFTLAGQDLSPMKDVPGFRANLERMSSSVKTISCSFIQEKNLVVLSEKIISKGTFFYAKENRIRWEYTSPYKYLIVINGDRLMTKSDGNQKIYDLQTNRMFQEMNRFMAGFIQGEILKNEKDYSAAFFEDPGYFYVKLTPKNTRMQQMLSLITIWFDRTDMSVAGIMMTEPGDDYTKIEFINRKLNVEIPAEKFAF